jgi:L-lactate dehydrogenase (cytochrome)
VAAAVTQIPQMVSSNASFSPAAIVASIRRTSAPAPPFFYQLYKHRTDHVAAERIREVEQLGYKAIWLTVDAVAWGNRETDVRSIWDDVEEESLGGQSDPDNVDVEFGGTAAKLTLNDDADLSWGKVSMVLTRCGLLTVTVGCCRLYLGCAA